MENIDNKTVAEIVTENIKTADVFKKNGIDFCCGGHVSVQEICAKKGVDYATLKEEILKIGGTPKNAHDFSTWELDFLADYIINTHHKYVVEANTIITQYAEKVAKVHGHHYTEVVEINELFKEIAAELNSHMRKEEMILFPHIKEMALAKKEGKNIPTPAFGSIQNPITMMEDEHTGAGDILRKIAELSNNYTPPTGACNTFRALYNKLEEYQNDLFQHIHLENNILFPKAILLEKELI
ncbi:MAG: iron-sulfur cluster repair di-iron protein [Bacteroidetes bacterium HGW-Bacteroidetes-12]|jgi:regulator of cell morphogenesis and NO signaling|nr:MAG: iron-sulfur cluster repair di-iron protein [Bacteroidetes bacterium HGW-Bacteroidetes-12]